MLTKSLALAGALAASLLATAAHADLVTNGDFTSAYTVSTQFGTNATVSDQQGVTGWTGNDGYDIWFPTAAASSTENTVGQYSGTGLEKLYGPVTAPPGATSFIGLDGDQTAGVQGGISQTITGLVTGVQYTLSFEFAAGQLQSRTGATTEQLEASLGSENDFTQVVSNPSESFTGWFSEVLTFTATSSSELLSFLSIGTPSGLPPMALLADVSLNQVPVPEPMSLTLLGVGLIGLGAARRRRSKA